mgnify:CR=1 FL=1
MIEVLPLGATYLPVLKGLARTVVAINSRLRAKLIPAMLLHMLMAYQVFGQAMFDSIESQVKYFFHF